MAELRELFFESAAELVEKLNEEALRLEKSPGDAETARSLRRIVHTLKGDAAACSYRELSELAHELEDALALESQSPIIAELALRAADVFTAIIAAYKGNRKLPSLQALREEIARLAPPAGESAAPGKSKARARPASMPWSEYERLAIAQAAESGKRIHHVIVRLDPRCGMPIAARQMIQIALASLGEVLALYPPDGTTPVDDRIEAALASESSVDEIRAKCRIPTIAQTVKVTPLKVPAPAQTVPESELKEHSEVAPKTAGVSAADEPAARSDPAATAATAASAGENILRVDAERIDTVLNLVGELILAKSMLQQTLVKFSARFPKDGLRAQFSDAMALQARVLSDLQRSVMKIRMVPVDQLFRRFPRTVRDVARQSGKQVELVVRGEDTDLDKGILDSIAEPLMHLLRNAVGHGIEAPEARARLGKRPQGTVTLAAYHQGNQVVIEVSDDGGGIDAQEVREHAVRKGLLKAEEAAHLSESETLELILRPGFSTVKEITELSGRGIGLDVVQSVLTRLKGSVQIETSSGRGTTFRLRLPLTLAILRALLFRVDERLYALPLNAVNEITRATEDQIHEVEHYEVLRLRNEVLPLLRLGATPEAGAKTAKRKVFVLVVHRGDRKFGLLVNELAGEAELVIKALDDQALKTSLVSGASILGDGRVVLILNLIALVDRFTGAGANPGVRMAGLLANLNSAPRSQHSQTLGMAGARA